MRAYVGKKRVKTLKGHRVRHLTLARLPQGYFRVKIVTTTARGAHATSVRYYRGCYKTKPRDRGDAPASTVGSSRTIGRRAADRQVKQDLTTAMKAGEKDRVGALRLVLSELQKAAKDGDGDELAVLRRERKRRLEAATAFRDGGRDELADAEAEAELAHRGLPARRAGRRRAARDRRATPSPRPARRSPKDMGAVMKAAMAQGRRPRRRQARLRARRGRRCA